MPITCETLITVKCSGHLAVAQKCFHSRTDFQYRVSNNNDNEWLLELRDHGPTANNDSGAQMMSDLLRLLANLRHDLSNAGVFITHVLFHHFKNNGQWGLHLTLDDCRALNALNAPLSYCPAWSHRSNTPNDFPERFTIGPAEICCYLSLRDPHDAVHPEVITSQLDLQPTTSHVKGSTVPSGRHIFPHNDWRYSQCRSTSQPLDFFTEFLHTVKEKRAILERLNLLSHSHISFFILPEHPADTCPVTLSPEMIQDFLSTGIATLIVDPTPSTFFRKP